MATVDSVVQSALGYGRKVLDEAVIRGVMDYATRTAEEEAREGARKLKVRIFGWGSDDERVSFVDQTKLGRTAVDELNRYFELLNNRDTFRLRMIMSGIESQEDRLRIYRMILDTPTHEERKRQLDQICQKPEYISGCARWLWQRFKLAAQNREMRDDLRNIMRDIDQAAGDAPGTLWGWFSTTAATAAHRTAAAARVIDDECGRLAAQLRDVNQAKQQQQRQPQSSWRSVLWLFTGIGRP